MEPKAIFEKLQARFGEGVFGYAEGGGVKDPFCKVKPDSLVDAALYLRDDPELRFDFLQCLSAVDWPKQAQIEVVYHLYSYPLRHAFVVKVDAPRDGGIVPSVTGVWPTANWHEREQYDLLGVQFRDHPELRRLMMPDDWVGHPMRKDYKEPAEYRGMSTSRYSPTELFVAFDKANPQAEGKRPVAPPAPPKAEGKEAKPAAAAPAKPAPTAPAEAKPAPTAPAEAKPAPTAPAEAKPAPTAPAAPAPATTDPKVGKGAE